MPIKTISEAGIDNRFNSCAFCAIGRGTHVYTDESGVKRYLCDAHKEQCYDSETDTVTAPPAPETEEAEAVEE